MIEVKNITKVFKNGKGIFNVSFKILENKIIAFVGNNGSGKTTTIKSILNEYQIQNGEVLMDGENIFENDNLHKVAFFPDSNNIPLELTINEYINYIAVTYKISKNEYIENLNGIYNLLDLEEHQNTKLKKLSAGWKKWAIMATVLILKPRYIFFDEPTANLDIEGKIKFWELLNKLSKFKITLIITSHILEELQEIANYLVLIDNGKIVYENDFNNQKENIINIYQKFQKVKEKK